MAVPGKKDVVAIDINPEALQRVSDHLDVQTLQGSGSNPRVLEESGRKTADIILAVTDKDEVNLIVCFFANVIDPHIQKAALIRNPDYISYREALTRDILNIGLVIHLHHSGYIWPLDSGRREKRLAESLTGTKRPPGTDSDRGHEGERIGWAISAHAAHMRGCHFCWFLDPLYVGGLWAICGQKPKTKGVTPWNYA
jgi:hypothetical protein